MPRPLRPDLLVNADPYIERNATALLRHPGTPVPTYLEAYEFSEYGRAPTPAELAWFE